MKNRSIQFLLFIIVLMLFVIYSAFNFRYVQAKFLPIVVASLVFLLSLIELRHEAGIESAKSDTQAGRGENLYELHRYLSLGGWLVGFLLVIYLGGFVVGMIVFIISYLKAQGRTWPRALMMASAVTAITYGLFSYFLGIELYRGIFFN